MLNVNVQLRFIMANFGPGNSSYHAHPHFRPCNNNNILQIKNYVINYLEKAG